MSKRIIEWVGLDVHAASIAVARLRGDATTAETTEIANEPKAIARYFKALAGSELRVCYEAGGCGYVICRQLRKLGIDCVVVAPSLIPKKPGEHVKTDRRDSIKLARLLRAGELTAVWVPDDRDEAVRDLVRAREHAREDRTSARHRLDKFLLRHGRHYSAGTHWTQKHWRWIREQKFAHVEAQMTFDHYVEQVMYLNERVANLEKKIFELAKSERYQKRVARLSALRGIATLNAMILLTELVDLRRFDNPRELMSFVGLTSREHSSGDDRKRGSITKAGNAHVRRALVQAAWAYRQGPKITARQHAVLADLPPTAAAIGRKATERLGQRYRKLIGRGKKPQTAVVAVARELCGFIWAMEVSAAA